MAPITSRSLVQDLDGTSSTRQSHLSTNHSSRLASPLVSACRYLLQPNGSINGEQVGKAILPNFPDLCSALPADYFANRYAVWGVNDDDDNDDGATASTKGRQPLTHMRVRDFILKEVGPQLHGMGYGRGDRIALILPNGPELAMAILSIAHWASCLPLNTNGTTNELKKDLRAAGAALIIGIAGNDSAAIEDMARGLNIPFCGLEPSTTEVGIFRLVPSSMNNTKNATTNMTSTNATTTLPRNLRLVDTLDYENVLDDGDGGGIYCGAPLCHPTSTGDIFPTNSLESSMPTGSNRNLLSNNHNDEVLVLFTSGTTGKKKLVPHNLGDMLIASAIIAVSWDLSPNDVNCNLMPLFHVGGIVRQVFAPILSAGSVICCPSFDPQLFWSLLLGKTTRTTTTTTTSSSFPLLDSSQQTGHNLSGQRNDHHQRVRQEQQHLYHENKKKKKSSHGGFTWYYAAPTMHQIILSTMPANAKPKLRMIANAAGGLLPSLAEELRNVFDGANVLPSYGMTECMPIASPPYSYQLEKPGTSGVAVGPEVTIFSGEFEILPPGREGYICVRGRPCFRGYGGQSEKKSSSFLEGGWFNTGDLGYLDEDGYLYITGRSKEVINRGGEIISPLEIEDEVIKHPSVTACLAFSVPHDVLQETVGIIIVSRSNCPRIDLPTLHCFLQERLTTTKWPQCMVFMDSLPKSHTNKLLRVKLGRRLNLPTFDDDMLSPVERTYEATCPPQGTPVSMAIPCDRVHVNIEYIQDVLQSELDVVEDSYVDLFDTDLFDASFPQSDDGNGNENENHKDYDNNNNKNKNNTNKNKNKNNNSEKPQRQLLVTPHPTKNGGVVVHVVSVDRIQVIRTAKRCLDAYLQPGYVISYTSTISTTPETSTAGGTCTIRQPESSDSVSAILVGTSADAMDPLVQELQELVRELIDLDCLPAPDTNFFHIGGSSLLASQLASKIRKRYNVSFAGADVFRYNTCLGMSSKVHGKWDTDEKNRMQKADNNQTKSLSDDMYDSRSTNNHNKNNKGLLMADSFEEFFKKIKVDLQDAAPFDLTRLRPQNSICTSMFQLFPLFGLFPVWQFSRIFLFFMSLLAVLKRVPGEYNILKFVLVLCGYHLLWICISPLLFILIKWIVIGKYRKGRYACWSWYYLRWWFVDVCRKLFGRGIWGSHNATLLMYYRLLGANIGRDVTISLQAEIAEFDLITIGNNAIIEYSTLRGFGVDNGAIFLGPVTVGDSSSIGIKSVVAPNTKVPSGSHLGPASSSYELNHDDDYHLSYNRKAVPEPKLWMLTFVAHPIMFLVDTISHVPALFVLYFMVTAQDDERDDSTNTFETVGDLMEWLCQLDRIPYFLAIRVVRSIVAPFFYMAAAILVKWTVIGKFRPGPRNLDDQWGLTKHWLAQRLFCRENMQDVTDLLGRHYETVSTLYRLLGAKVGQRVFWPGHQPIFTGEFDLLEIGDDVVFGSRAVIICSQMNSFDKVIFCAGSNVSDNTVVLPGSIIGKNAVLGSNTVCPAGRYLPEGSIWLGSRGGEPMLLEPGVDVRTGKNDDRVGSIILSSEVLKLDEDTTIHSLPMIGDETTLRPFGKAVYHREASYFVWPAFLMMLLKYICSICFEIIHLAPLLGSLHLGACILYGPSSPNDRVYYDDKDYSMGVLYCTMVWIFLVLHFGRVLFCHAIEIATKWLLIGRRSEGRYNWDKSRYSQNWEFYQMMTQIRKLNRTSLLDFVSGTTYLVWFFRALGCKVGKDCCLYPSGGDPYMPEPDLVSVGDRCVVDMSSIVCHLNTRGNLELVPIVLENHVTLRARSRIQQGVHVGAGSMVLEKSLVLTGEVIETDNVWQGSPASRIFSYHGGQKGGILPSTSYGYDANDLRRRELDDYVDIEIVDYAQLV